GGQGVSTSRWLFCEETLPWGSEVLERSVPTDVLVVDELGVLEFERGEGWLSGLRAIDSRQYRFAWVSVRPSLLQNAKDRWKESQGLDISAQATSNISEDYFF